MSRSGGVWGSNHEVFLVDVQLGVLSPQMSQVDRQDAIVVQLADEPTECRHHSHAVSSERQRVRVATAHAMEQGRGFGRQLEETEAGQQIHINKKPGTERCIKPYRMSCLVFMEWSADPIASKVYQMSSGKFCHFWHCYTNKRSLLHQLEQTTVSSHQSVSNLPEFHFKQSGMVHCSRRCRYCKSGLHGSFKKSVQ